jgi:hypothetical protein
MRRGDVIVKLNARGCRVRQAWLVALTVAFGALQAPECAFAQGGFNGPGRYEISDIQSGKALDMDRNDQRSVIQFELRRTDNQIWQIERASQGYYFIRNAMNGNALEAVSNRRSTPVEANPFHGGPSQQWRIEPKDGSALIIARMGKTLDIPDGTGRNGVRVQTYDVNGDEDQRFTFRRAGGGGRNWSRGAWDGQDRRDSGDNSYRVTCSSNDGRHEVCEADTRGGVRMIRQLSGSACEQGRTWGYDRRGIWVDRGCRAEFEVRNGGRPDRGRDRWR